MQDAPNSVVPQTLHHDKEGGVRRPLGTGDVDSEWTWFGTSIPKAAMWACVRDTGHGSGLVDLYFWTVWKKFWPTVR